MIKVLVFLTVAIVAATFFIYILPPFRSLPYADDWVFTLPLRFQTGREWWYWIVQQHVDHRIPIEKVIGFPVLRVGQFDFRYMVGLNFLMGMGISLMLIKLTIGYRGYALLGDLCIPLATMSFGTGYTLWGFQFQFVSSMFFLTLFVFTVGIYQQSSRRSALYAACVAILCASLSGLNGLVAADFATAGLVAWLIALRGHDGDPILYSLLIACVAIQILIWVTWVPTAASNGSLDPVEFGRFMVGLVPGSMIVYAFGNTWWKFLVIAALFGGAAACVIRCIAKRRLDITQAMLFVSALACLAILASISVGRAKIQGGWNPGLALHYGFLSILIPLASWIILSRALPRRYASILGVLVAVLFARAFEVNLLWRLTFIEAQAAHQEEVLRAVQQTEDVAGTVDRYIADLTLPGDARVRDEIVAGIETLRRKGYSMYGPRE